ncbi:MAG: hypothetical protein JWM93_3482 [Frankiales bacterium]|nr:hypothetical protein [Frankiales bacterium]
MTTVSTSGRRSFTDYVPVWAIALLTVAALWAGIIALATSSAFPTQARISGTQAGKCVVEWTSAKGEPRTSDIACLGRHPGDEVTLLLSEPESQTFADRRAVGILEWIGLLFTLVPGMVGVAGRALGIRRARTLAS